MYAMNIQNDVIGLVLCENCKSKQMTGIIAWPSRCHGRIPFIGNSFIYTNLCNISWFVSIPIQLKLRWFVKSSYWLEVLIKIKSNRNQSSKKITSSWQRFCLFREWLHHHIFLQLYKILYNYSLLLRSIQVFIDLKIDIHQSL